MTIAESLAILRSFASGDWTYIPDDSDELIITHFVVGEDWIAKEDLMAAIKELLDAHDAKQLGKENVE